jgi:hypothetical protein
MIALTLALIHSRLTLDRPRGQPKLANCRPPTAQRGLAPFVPRSLSLADWALALRIIACKRWETFNHTLHWRSMNERPRSSCWATWEEPRWPSS